MQSSQLLNPLVFPKGPLYKSETPQSVDICYVGTGFVEQLAPQLYSIFNFNVDVFDGYQDFSKFFESSSLKDIPAALLLEADTPHAEKIVKQIRSNPVTGGIIIILLSKSDSVVPKIGNTDSVNDIYYYPFNAEAISDRISFLIKFKLLKPDNGFQFSQNLHHYKPPVFSRIFSFTAALITIILLSPVLLLTALIIKLESKGPVIYKSKRAGTGYQVFDFYKFRSMVADADKKLKDLSKTNNQYGNEGEAGQTFVKILNDPRITPFGRFMRKTSLDELPQLFNVLKGDMMLVGNRPLPLYEAEMLTSDEFAMRFLGPAGITGLWQISKRGKAEMSESERKELDNHYAKDRSFLMDIKIMLKTLPAMFQKANV